MLSLSRQELDEQGESRRPLLVVPSPAGRPMTQALAREWASRAHVVMVCGRYEGIDQRLVESAGDEFDVVEASLGDFVVLRRRSGSIGVH